MPSRDNYIEESQLKTNGVNGHLQHHDLDPFSNEKAQNGQADDVRRYESTGISVLIVGAGMGGVLSALEGWRKGHSVQVLERSEAPVYTGVDAICL